MTTVDRARSGTTALYREPFHVGQHGQEIIEQTIAYRLRRGAVAPEVVANEEVRPAVPVLFAAALGSAGDVPAWPY